MHWLLDLVSHGLGIAVVPQIFTTKRTAARFVPLTAPPHWQVAVETGRHPSTAATALLSLDDIRPRLDAAAPAPATAQPTGQA